jgi:predicted RNA binding protein YcfA (HicA-like mRNA interferase family)
VRHRLKVLSGQEVLRILQDFGFTAVSQRGSHVKLARTSPSGAKETMTVPVHPELDIGTLRAIFRQACRYIPERELAKRFYTTD